MTLWNLKKGESAKIIGFQKDLPNDYLTRLYDLGMLIDETIQCVLKPGLGAPSIFQIQNSIYSLDKNISDKIQVEKIKVSPNE